MRRGLRGLVVALALALALAAMSSAPPAIAATRTRQAGTGTTKPVPAPPEPPPPGAGPPPAPHAWALVDADTGAVVDAGADREPVRVASVFKVLTALVVEENLPPSIDIPVSAKADGMPAAKMNIKTGQTWRSDDLLHALLIISANDAAVALAERTAGSLELFQQMLETTAVRLGFADHPVLHDPAGLDDEFSVGGGNLISARDLAIATRAFLAYPHLAEIVTEPIYKFHGGDGNDHRLVAHNPLLKAYPGAIGIKTGYTRKAGHSIIGAASRDGRTMVAVVLGAGDPTKSAELLLDKGFATPVAAEEGLDHLPAVVKDTAAGTSQQSTLTTAAMSPPRPLATGATTAPPVWWRSTSWHRAGAALAVGAIPALLVLVRRRRIVRRRRKRKVASWG